MLYENGWEHFRPNTPEGAYRQKMLDGLYHYYGKHEGCLLYTSRCV